MAWFICPYIWTSEDGFDFRYCAMDDYTEQLRADDGRLPQHEPGELPLWAEAEFLGDRAIVKVATSASPAMLAVLEAESTFMRIPAEVLDIALEDQNVSNPDLNRMWAAMVDAGYTQQDMVDLLGIDRWQDLRRKSLRELINAMLSRWRRPSGVVGEFETTDWPGGSPSSIEAIDARIS